MSVPSELTRWAYTDPPRAIYELYQLITGGGQFLPLAGGTLTGGLSLNYNSPTFGLNKTAAAQINGIYGYLSGATRWGIIPGDSAPESGGNAGSNFDIARFSDSGAFIDMPLTISRSNGIVAFSNSPTAPTPGTADNSTNIATTAYVQAQGYAPLSSPTFTGSPTSVTPSTADNSTNIATTAYVKAQGYAVAANYLPLTGGTLSGSLNMTAGNYQYGGKTLAYIVANVSGDSAFFGESGNTTLTGLYNLGSGTNAAVALTSGSYNTGLGAYALNAQTTGGSNTGTGVNALRNEASGSSNTALGFSSLTTQNGAGNNTGLGMQAGYDLTTGSSNTIVGYNTGRGITTGGNNTVIGANLTGLPAALANTLVVGAGSSVMGICGLGVNATFFGLGAGNLTVSGSSNTGVGVSALKALTSGSNNVAFGLNAAIAETTGNFNTAIGRNALAVQNGASTNTALGYNAGPSITTGGSNILIGSGAGNGITTGTGNTILGYSTAVASGLSNAIILAGGGVVRYDWSFTTSNIHTFGGGGVTVSASTPTLSQNATPAAGANPVFQSAGALSQASATTNTPALPSTRTNGWLMVAFCRVTGSTGTTLTCPTTGWTQILNNAGGGRTVMAAYAYVTGSEVAPVFTLGTSDTSDAQVVMYSGTAATNPIGASAVSSGASVTTLNLTGITTTRYNSKVIASILCNGLSGSLTPPAAFTQQVSNTDGAWFDAPEVAAGTALATQAFTCSPAVTNWGGFLVELLIPPMTPLIRSHVGQVLGTNRWGVTLGDATQESGSNAGSNFAIQRFSDAGVAIDTPISINRATGQTTITNLNPATLLRSYLAGLGLSTAGSSATFTVAAGIAVDSTNVNIMSRTASLSKTTNAWAVGASAGSLDTGTIAASTWYHVHLIMRTDTGVVDVLTSLSATAPTLPTSYTLFRRIGSMLTNASSQWTKFLQTGDIFEWDVGVQEINGGSLSSGSAVTVTLAGVPTGVKVVANISGYATCTTAAATVAAWDADITGSATNNFLFICPAANNENSFAHGMMVNASAQFKWQSSANFTGVNLFTTGWTDRRGRDA